MPKTGSTGCCRNGSAALPANTGHRRCRGVDFDLTQIRRNFDRAIRVCRGDAGDLPKVVRGLLIGEFQTVCGRDDHHPLVRADDLALDELAQGREGDTGVWAVEHAGAIGTRGLVGQLGLARLLHHALELPEDADGALVTHRVADLDGARQGLLGLHRRERLEVLEEGQIKRVGVLRLGDRDAGQLLNEAELAHHQEALAEGADIAEVAAGDDDPIGDFPPELLYQLDGHGLLAFDPQAVHRIGQINVALCRDLLHESHAAVEIRVQTEDERAVGEGLNELRR